MERWTRKMGLSKQWYGSLFPGVWKFVSAPKGIYQARLQKCGVGPKELMFSLIKGRRWILAGYAMLLSPLYMEQDIYMPNTT